MPSLQLKLEWNLQGTSEWTAQQLTEVGMASNFPLVPASGLSPQDSTRISISNDSASVIDVHWVP